MRSRRTELPKGLIVVIAIAIVVGFLAVMRVTQGILANYLILPGYGNSMIGELAGGIYAFVMLALLGYMKVLKEKGAGFMRGFFIAGFMTAYCLIELVAQFYVLQMNGSGSIEPVGNILMFAVTMFLIGFAEEIIFRGVILNLFLDSFSKTKRGILGAILLNGALFGAVHLINITSGVSVYSASIQAFEAALLGIIFAAIYARCRNIWILIIVHALTDFAALMGSGIFGLGNVIDGINNLSAINLIAVPIFLIPAIVLLRPSRLEEMEKRAAGMVVFDSYSEADSIALTSLILGVLGIVLGFMGYGLGLAVVGLLGSVISRKIKPQQNGVALAAMITSIIGIVIALCAVVIMSFFFSNMDKMLTNFL